MSIRTTLKRLDAFAVLSFLIPLFLYLLTLAPSVTFFDSGEFITATASLGAAHSPGYPLFINYAKPFTWLPFGSVAFRVNLATAISAGLACYGVYLLVTRLLKDEEIPGNFFRTARGFTGLCAAVTFAGTARLWLQSNHDKPYPLLAFICAVVFYLMLLWRESYDRGEERPSYVYLGAFLCGLGTGAHQIMVLMIPVYGWLIVSKNWRILFRVKEFLLALAFGILGFSIHLHLIVRALQKPLLNWGDSKNLTQFLWNMLRKGYPTVKPDRDLGLLWAQLNAFNVPNEFTVIGLALLLLGLLTFFSRQRDVVISYLIGLGSFFLVIVGYFNTPRDLIFLTEEFFTPLYLLSAVFIALGTFYLVQELAARLPAAWAEQRPLCRALLSLLMVLPLTVCLLHYQENDQHENYVAFDYASNTLKSLPEGAVLYTWGDSGAFPLWYVQGVERMREDLDLLHTPHLVFQWYLDAFPKVFNTSRLRSIPPEQIAPEDAVFVSAAEQIVKRPVYIDFSTRYSVQFSQFQPHQHGICYQLLPASQPLAPPDLDIWQIYSLRGVLGNDLFFRDLDTGKAIQIYAAAHMEAGETLLKMGFAQGLTELAAAQRIQPDLAPEINKLRQGYGVR
ncbi:membrane protein [Geomonas silvestris]|uniref:Membrane protein n=1 Tax=Geomonas silvestris TaxID=2740184 RepID=A0A6V8MDU3_9BACT|nr:DUF2723 domain-containing protein [Geomonas silvestris]GFO57963.1 membrane protein [Geomonas silvestris]